MRAKLSTIITAVTGAEGAAGVACLGGGAFLLWGTGVTLLVVGSFLLIGAWGRR